MQERFKGEVNPWRLQVEYYFNQFQPFYQSLQLYVLVTILTFFSWLGYTKPLQKSAYWLLILSFCVHTAGLVIRMYLQERPPVTNLYSSAIFVGWAAVLLGILMERIHRNGLGSAVAGMIGFSTLIIAHNLGTTGDTLEMMRAVLDSNFWLSTHVVTVTLGYSAMFLAGALAIIYVLRGVLTASLDAVTARALARMVYGTLCFATLFSFVGTMLGGVWADQSWGRFWGWDPKENGALIIVLWCAIVIHARWAKIFGERGLMVAALFGNIVTSWSWFGTNMLGVGLHNYGFMDRAFYALALFMASQVALMFLGLIPLQCWKSKRQLN
jgi:ABC-type transport system involved in cytochrome c biogenesis permease subunit